MTISVDESAHCRRPNVETDVFFPHDDSGARIEQAKRICDGCPFAGPCLDYALHNMVDGVWAGTTFRERRKIRAIRGIVAQPLSFGTGPTNTTIAKRMATRGTPVATIAAHLGVTTEAVYRILRDARMDIPEARGKRGIAQRASCPDCGVVMLRSSLGRHRRETCPAREDGAA